MAHKMAEAILDLVGGNCIEHHVPMKDVALFPIGAFIYLDDRVWIVMGSHSAEIHGAPDNWGMTLELCKPEFVKVYKKFDWPLG